MDPQQQFCLKWNSFGSNLASAFGNLFKSESLTDVTLFCEGVTFKAHKLILAACSKHFQDLFETAPLCPSGILVILDGTSSSNMSALLEFMYKGEVHVSQESLSSFLKAAECLQVKGLSIEHEKLAVVQGQHMVSHDTQLDSPTGRKQPKLNSNGSSSKDSLLDGAATGSEPLLQHHAPSTSSYSPVMSGYGMHPPLYRPAYEQRVPPSGPPPASLYDAGLPRKRQHRSSSDAPDARPSVLRDGSKAAEKHSPMALAYRPSGKQGDGPVRFDGGPDARDNAAANAAASAATAVTFDRTAAVDGDGNKSAPDSRRSSVDPGSSCPEDLRVKLELSSRPDEQHMNQAAAAYTEASVDKTPEITPANIWNSGTKLKGGSVTTTDGKKLQCPFCERLYGYETNLRAHIRQRHQGIRVHCPFCSRTFTRNNTKVSKSLDKKMDVRRKELQVLFSFCLRMKQMIDHACELERDNSSEVRMNNHKPISKLSRL